MKFSFVMCFLAFSVSCSNFFMNFSIISQQCCLSSPHISFPALQLSYIFCSSLSSSIRCCLYNSNIMHSSGFPPFCFCSSTVSLPPVFAFISFFFSFVMSSGSSIQLSGFDFDIFNPPSSDGVYLWYNPDGRKNLCFSFSLRAMSRVSLMCGSWSIPTGMIPGIGSFSCGYSMSPTCVIAPIILPGSALPYIASNSLSVIFFAASYAKCITSLFSDWK